MRAGRPVGRPYGHTGLISPLHDAFTDDVHDDSHRVNAWNGDHFASDGFKMHHKDRCAEEMKITDEEDQDDAFEWPFPERIFPYKMATFVQKTFHENAESWIADGKGPFFRECPESSLFSFGEGMVINDTHDAEHEHDFDIPAHHGSQGGVAGGCPEGGTAGQNHHPAVPGFVEKIHAENGQTCKYGLPVSGGFRVLISGRRCKTRWPAKVSHTTWSCLNLSILSTL